MVSLLSLALAPVGLVTMTDAAANERLLHARKSDKAGPAQGWPFRRGSVPRHAKPSANGAIANNAPARQGAFSGGSFRGRLGRYQRPVIPNRSAANPDADRQDGVGRDRSPTLSNRSAARAHPEQEDRVDRDRPGLLSRRSAIGPRGGWRDRFGHRRSELSNRTAAFRRDAQRRHPFTAFRPDFRRDPRLWAEHRRSIVIARSRLPHRPFPGERGFTGVPPAGERRFVPNEMVFQLGDNVSQQRLDAVARRLGLSTVSSQSFGLTGSTLVNFRIADGRRIDDVVRALEAEDIGIAQPNYVFTLQQDNRSSARVPPGDPKQYVVSRLRLGEVHRVATGSNVVVAVIDSQIDAEHPDLDGAVVERFDAVGRRSEPHAHGTGMAGAIAARRALTGIAPGAKILGVHAFSPDSKEAPQATTRQILAGIEWAIRKGARVINMSFAGPYDPILQLAIKRAHEKGVVLIAAAGNLGSKSPPLYPAADPHVIAVSATDQSDRLFVHANQGPHVAVSAPGVDIIEPAPNAGYQVTTGTSVAAAHVSGVAALLIERDPSLDPAAIHELLTATAQDAGSKGRDDRFGWGLVDPSTALLELEAKVAEEKGATAATPAASKSPPPRASYSGR
jgi:hypothetical protein